MARTSGSLLGIRSTPLLLFVLAIGTTQAIGDEGLGRTYPIGQHHGRGRYRWPYHVYEAAVPQKAGYGHYPTMWRDWHENAYLIFSEPEKSRVVLPERTRKQRAEELPEPDDRAPDDDWIPPPDVFPPSELPDLPGQDLPPRAAPPAGVPDFAPPGQAPETPDFAPPADEPELPDLPDSFPGLPDDVPALPGGAGGLPGGPTSARPRTIRSSQYEGPVLQKQGAARQPARAPQQIAARTEQASEAATLRALSQGFTSDSRVQPASAQLPVEWSKPERPRSDAPRTKVDRQVAPASANLPAASAPQANRAPFHGVSRASYESDGLDSIRRAIAYEPGPVESAPARSTAVRSEPAAVSNLSSERANPLRDATTPQRASNAGRNPLRR